MWNYKQLKKYFIILFGGITVLSVASNTMATDLTLIQFTDYHGALLPHPGKIHDTNGNQRYVTQGGGLAKTATVIKQIRAEAKNSLLLSVGDAVHGSAEVMFTVGDAIMPALNAMGIDAFTPGNWEFGYGPAVFRNRFATFGPKPPLPGNIQVMANAYDGPGVTAATFPVVALNLYNDASSAPLPTALHNKRVLNPYKIFDVEGVKVAILGITGTFLAHSNPAFNIGLRFTQGVDEMQATIDAAKAEGAEFIVVQSEMGFVGDLQLAREFDDINIVLSSHTHELTTRPFIADKSGYAVLESANGITSAEKVRLKNGGTLLVEVASDTMLGRLDLTLLGGKIKNASWDLVAVDDDVVPDPTIAALVAHAEEPFIAGKDGIVERHSFLPGGYCPGNVCGDTSKRGLQLTEDLDTVVGFTDVQLHREDVLERLIDNFISDAFVAATDGPVKNQTPLDRVDLASTNGFRFGVPVLSTNEVPANASFPDGRTTGEITLRDLYSIYPIAAAIVAAEVPGQSLKSSMETMLSNNINRHAYLQRGGWYVGYSDTVFQHVDLINKPYASADGRVVKTWIHGVPFDISKRYVKVGFYGHSYEMGQVSRTKGGVNQKYFELANPDDYSSAITVVDPLNTENIVVLNQIKQVAPDAFLHPVHTMRRFLDSLPNKTVTEAQFGTGRVVNVDTTQIHIDPVLGRVSPESPLPAYSPSGEFNQPIEGLGPDWSARPIN